MDIGFVFKVAWALGLVAVLLYALVYVIRALSRGRLVSAASRKLVTVVESTAVAQNVTVHVVKVGERFYLLGGGSAGLSKIDDIPAEMVTPWLDEQKRTVGQQRDAVLRLIGKMKTP